MDQEGFRFVQLIAARQRPVAIALDFRATPFMQLLLDAIGGGSGPGSVHQLAEDFASGPDFNSDPADLAFTVPARLFIEELRGREAQSLAAYDALIEDAFGRDAESLVHDNTFGEFRNQVSDRLISLKLLPPEDHPGALSAYVALQRVIAIVNRVAEADAVVAEVDPRVLLSAAVELPQQIFPLPRDAQAATDEPVDETADEVARLNAELDGIELAADEVLTLGAHDLDVVGPVDETRIGTATNLSAATATFTLPEGRNVAFSSPAQDFANDSDVVVRRRSVEALSEPTRHVLADVGIGADPVSLVAMVDRLERRAVYTAARLESLVQVDSPPRFIQLGTSTFPTNIPALPAGSSLANPPHPGVPTSVGQIRPSRVGLLRKTKMHILRYEAEEIAHAENVVIGERKNRQTRRLQRTEESFTREEETTTEEERDQQSTERNEFQRELSETLKQSQQFKVGASISAGYGPVEVSVDTEFSTESSLESTNRTASSFAREVMEKTAQRITERVREEQTRRTIQEFEETNEHGFENTTDEHISAMFQWLIKVYHAQVYECGYRLWVNVTVPEPQYFLVNTLEKLKGPVDGLVEPDPLDFSPGALKPNNYKKYVKRYQVDGVRPPPQRLKTVTKVFRYPESSAPQTEQPPEELTDSIEMGIEPGYKAVSAYLVCFRGQAKHGAVSHDNNPNDMLTGASVFVGESITSFISDQAGVIKGNYHKPLSNEVGSIMIGIHARNIRSYVLGVQITLMRTDRALADWQLQTYDAIVARYQALLADYRDRKAEAEAKAGTEIQGRNPLENRLIERTELTRSAVSMLTGQYFEEFDAILGFMEGRIDFDEAIPEGRYARFFMNCFEWENMAYQFYPYFWARKSTWKKKLLLQDVDPLHAEFLKCGYADIELPVRPGFEPLLMHWLDTGRVWQGAEPPEITDPRYAPLLDDLQQRRADLDEDAREEIPVDEPWEITLPTTLVRIRPGNSLPEWELDAETGEFLPVPENA